MPRKGRRRTTTRTGTGRAVAQRQSITTPEIETRRRNLLGDHDKHSQAWRTDQRLGTVLGQMHCVGRLTDRQYEAGKAVTSVWSSWARQAESPPRHSRAASLPVATPSECSATAIGGAADRDDEADRWVRTREAMDALREAVNAVQHSALAWSLLDTVCCDGLVPPALEGGGPLAEKCWAALRGALDAAAGVFKIPEARAA